MNQLLSTEAPPGDTSTAVPALTPLLSAIGPSPIPIYPLISSQRFENSPLIRHQLMLARGDAATVDALTRSQITVEDNLSKSKVVMQCARQVEAELATYHQFCTPESDPDGHQEILNKFNELDSDTASSSDLSDCPDSTAHSDPISPGTLR